MNKALNDYIAELDKHGLIMKTDVYGREKDIVSSITYDSKAASKERGARPHANGTVSARTYRGGVSRWDESPSLQTSCL